MQKPYVFVTRKLPEKVLEGLREIAEVGVWPSTTDAIPRDQLMKEAKRAAGLLTLPSDRLDEELFASSTQLKVVANFAVGYDNIDTESAMRHGITVCHTPNVLTDTTADLTFSLILAAARRVVEAAVYVREGQWKNTSPLLLAGTDVHHKTIGIVGMGRIGEAVAKRAAGFDMNILYHNRNRKAEAEQKWGAKYRSFHELLEEADFVVNLAPLTEETENLFNEEAFARMKSSAIFINAGRGGSVDEDALVQALKTGGIAGAGLDVFKEEPMPESHPLVQMEQVVALPHIGSATMETRYAMAKLACENVISVLKGNPALTPIPGGK